MKSPVIKMTVIVLVILTVILVLMSVRVVSPGMVGIQEFLGKVKPNPVPAGLHFINPFARLRRFSTKTLEIKQTVEAPAQDQLSVTLQLSILYNYNGTRIPELVKTVGPNHEIILSTIIEPTFRSVIRESASDFGAMELYTTARELYTNKVHDTLANELTESRGINIEKVLLRDVKPPGKVTDAIEKKIEAEQISLQMEFVLNKETKEAERKRIEASGIRDANKIISQGLTAAYIKWYRLEMLKEFAKSDNNTILVIPEDLKSVPMILRQ